LVKGDLIEPNCSENQSIKDGSTTLCGCFEIEASRDFCGCQIVNDLRQAPDGNQRLV